MRTHFERWWRLAAAAFVAVALLSWAPGGVSAAWTTDVTGTVHSKNEAKETIILITDDLGVKNQPITVDMSDLSSAFRAIGVGQSVTLTLAPRASDSYLAYAVVVEGSYVQRSDLGTQERFETRGSSIKAHVGNVPEDDEALSQQHRQNDLKRGDD